MSRHTEMARKMQAVWGLYGHMDKQRHVAPYILDCVLAITWSEPSWLAERTLDILKSPYWLLSKMKNECSQDTSKACSLESIILGFTLYQNCPLKSKTWWVHRVPVAGLFMWLLSNWEFGAALTQGVFVKFILYPVSLSWMCLREAYCLTVSCRAPLPSLEWEQQVSRERVKPPGRVEVHS